MRRALKQLALAVLALLVTLAALGAWTFSGMGEVVHGARVASAGLTLVKDVYVASFIVDAGPGEVVLIDAGLSADAAPILAALAERGLDRSAVRAIFLTHGHGDHTAGCAAFPGVPVYAMAEELPLIEGRAAPRGPIPRLFGAQDSGVRATALPDGASITVGDLTVTGYRVPGHTDGSAVWLARGALYLGDSADFSASGELLGAKWVFTDDAARNHEALLALRQRLDREGVTIDVLASSHSGLGSPEALRAYTR
jgi:hydroxyacylglutathione hydrolase